MRNEKIREVLKGCKESIKRRKKEICIGLVTVVFLAGGGYTFAQTSSTGEVVASKVETSVNKKESKEVKEAEKELDELKNKDTSNLSNEEKKELEDKIAEAEEKVNKAVEVASNSVEDGKSDGGSVNTSQTSGSNASSSSSEASKPAESSKPVETSKQVETSEPVKKHTHTWVDITEEVVHPEEGHWEEVVIKPEQVKEVPIYERVARDICNGCGLDITENPVAHIKEQALKGNYACGGHHTEYREVQTGTKKEVIPAVTEKKWIVDKPAWTETKVVGRKCKECGANE